MDSVVFISQVNYVDANVSYGIEQLAAKFICGGTGGQDRRPDRPGPDLSRTGNKAAYLWSGKTPAGSGMIPWPAFLDPSNTTPED